ncbi:MAG: M16 family metallopeptidase [Candidatus Bipolaricaulia bacterium]
MVIRGKRRPLVQGMISVLIAAVLLLGTAPGLAESPSNSNSDIAFPDPAELVFPPIEFTPSEPERVELENGMVLYLLEDHELPIVEARAFIRADSVYDSLDKAGLASLTTQVMRTGGTERMTGDELDERLEFLAASASTSRFSTLTEHLDEVIGIFADILMHPVFEAEKLELAKQRTLERIRRENDRPTQVAVREFTKRVTEGHPLSRFSTEETIRNITREDLVQFHQRFYHPNNLVLAVAGDFQTDELIEKIQTAFAEWEPVEIDFPEIPPLGPESERVVYYAPKQVGQSTIIMGHPALQQRDPDFTPFTLMNRILGGSPAADDRLFREIRARRGLAYAVGSFLSGGQRFRGIFGAFSITRADATGTAIQLLLEELERIRTEPVSQGELEKTKNAIINRFVFQYTSALQIAARAASLEYNDLPQDYDRTFLEQVRDVTSEEIMRVAQQYLRPDEIVIMVGGDRELFDLDLEIFGEVVTIDLEQE